MHIYIYIYTYTYLFTYAHTHTLARPDTKRQTHAYTEISEEYVCKKARDKRLSLQTQ